MQTKSEKEENQNQKLTDKKLQERYAARMREHFNKTIIITRKKKEEKKND